MIEWIQEIFSSPSEQARLVTVLISVVLAISLVLLNQWFSRRKTKNDLTIEKLEKLASSLYSFQRVASSLVHSFFLAQRIDEEKKNEIIDDDGIIP